MEICEKIKEVRKAAGLNGTQFAKELHISKGYVSEIERGNKAPSESLMELIVRRFKVSTEWWETEEGEIFEAPGAPGSMEEQIMTSKIRQKLAECDTEEKINKFTADFFDFMTEQNKRPHD